MRATTHEYEHAAELLRELEPEELMTAAETARFLNVPLTWVYEHVRAKSEDRLPFVKLGKYLRFHKRDLDRYLDAKGEASGRSRRH